MQTASRFLLTHHQCLLFCKPDPIPRSTDPKKTGKPLAQRPGLMWTQFQNINELESSGGQLHLKTTPLFLKKLKPFYTMELLTSPSAPAPTPRRKGPSLLLRAWFLRQASTWAYREAQAKAEGDPAAGGPWATTMAELPALPWGCHPCFCPLTARNTGQIHTSKSQRPFWTQHIS